MTHKEKIQFLKRLVTGKASIHEFVIPKVLIKINKDGTIFYNENARKLLTNNERSRIIENVRESKRVRIKVTYSSSE